MRNRIVIVVALVACLVGVLPPPPAQAFQGPVVPIAPPVTGFCATPWGAVACIAGAAAALGGEALLWWDHSMVGYVATDDGWCMTDTGHMFTEGSASCTTPTVHMSPELEALARGTFDGVVIGGAVDRTQSAVFYPTDPEANTHLGVTVHSVVIQVSEGGKEVQADVVYDPPVDGCATAAVQGAMNHVSVYPEWGLGNINAWVDAECVLVSMHTVPGVLNAPSTPSQAYFMHDPETRLQSDPSTQCGGTFDGIQPFRWGGGSGTTRLRWTLATVDPDPDCFYMWTPTSRDPIGYVLISRTSSSSYVNDPMFIEIERSDLAYEGFYKTTTACRAADGTVTMRTASSVDSFVVGAASGTLPEAGCLAGEVPISTTVEICDANGVGCIEAATWAAPPMTEAEYGCFINAGSGGEICPMWLEYWDGDAWQECVPAVAGECTDWWTNPGRDLVFRCGWGGDYYTASQCQALKNWYNVDEPDPETDLAPVNPNEPSGDPGVDAPTVTPDPETGHLPGTISGPSTPPSSRPTEPWLRRIVTEWSTGSTANFQSACWPQGWGLLNPLQWVMRPIMCALTFLFVPSESVDVKLQTAWNEALETTRLGTMIEAGDLVAAVPEPAVGSSCGWGIPAVDTGTFVIPEVEVIMCPSDYGLSGTASTARSWGFAVVGLWTIGMLLRWLEVARPEAFAGEEGVQDSLFS